MAQLKDILDEFFPQKKAETPEESPVEKLIGELKEIADQISSLVDSFDTNKEKLNNPDSEKSDDEIQQIHKEQIQYLRHALKFNITSIAKVYKRFIQELDAKKVSNKDVEPKPVDSVKGSK